jgi:putative peptide zinc metalloprotease protein
VEIARRAGAWIIRTPEGRDLLVNEHTASLLSLCDGVRTLADLETAVQARHPGADAAPLVARFVARLAETGVLEGPDAQLPPAAANARARTMRVRLFDPTPLLEPLCRLARATPHAAILAVLAGLVAGGMLGALARPDALRDSLSLSRLWDRLPATASFAWLMGIWHELAHGMAALFHGGRVRSISIAQRRWRVLLCVEIPDLLVLPRRARMRVAAAGPLADGLLGSAALCAGWLLPGLHDLSWSVVTAALLRVAWNLVPALRTDGAYLLSEVLGEPGLEPRARHALAAWLRARGRPASGVSSSGPLALYGLLTVAFEVAVIVVLATRIAQGVLGAR